MEENALGNCNLELLISNLSWDEPINVQDEAMKVIIDNINDVDIKNLIDWNKKSTWDNVSKIISAVGYPTAKPLLMEMLKFYQDVNWPGVDNITAALENFDRKYLIDGIEKTAEMAVETKDYGWIFGINRLLDRLSINIEEFSDERLYKYIRENADKW
ncbi:MAG: hypothetical protein ACI4SS_01985 [Clostridia bacterium]